MKIKTRMIGFDLDGTLLTTEKELTKRCQDAMERAIAQGLNFCLQQEEPCAVSLGRYLNFREFDMP